MLTCMPTWYLLTLLLSHPGSVSACTHSWSATWQPPACLPSTSAPADSCFHACYSSNPCQPLLTLHALCMLCHLASLSPSVPPSTDSACFPACCRSQTPWLNLADSYLHAEDSLPSAGHSLSATWPMCQIPMYQICHLCKYPYLLHFSHWLASLQPPCGGP